MSDNSNIDALIAIMTQGRAEDREDLAAIRDDMRELAKSVNKLTVSTTQFISDTRHINAEIEDIKDTIKEELHGENGVNHRISVLEIAKAEDKRNWLLLTTLAAIIFTGFVGYYFTVVQPIQNAGVTNSKVIELIDSINNKLDSLE